MVPTLDVNDLSRPGHVPTRAMEPTLDVNDFSRLGHGAYNGEHIGRGPH
jgi:hypothetical protein